MHQTRDSTTNYQAYAALCLIALLSVIVGYHPTISSYLIFDDAANLKPLLQSSGSLGSLWEAIRNNQSGPTGRPVSMVSFALQIGALGPAIWHLKAVNIFIHLLTGAALFSLTRTLVLAHDHPSNRNGLNKAFLIGGATAVLWLAHPFNLTSVAYLIQRMTSLSALFTALALLAYIRTRLDAFSVQSYLTGGTSVLVLGLLGLFSKENAALLPLYALIAEVTILRNTARPSIRDLRPRDRHLLVGVALVFGAGLMYVLVYQRLGGFDNRPFSLSERLLTESRVVSWYAAQTLAPNIGSMSLFQDHWQVSKGLLNPFTTLASILFLLALLFIGIAQRRKRPVISFGILMFLAGHVMESTALPLELVFEHRNYLPSFGLLLAVCCLGYELARRVPRSQTVYATVVVCALALLTTLTHVRAERWADSPWARIEHFAAQSGSMRAQIEAAQIYAALGQRSGPAESADYLSEAKAHFERAIELDPSAPEPKLGLLMFGMTNEVSVDIEALTQGIVNSLQSKRISATSLNGIHTLVLCVSAGACESDADGLKRILDAALSNPDISDVYRVLVLRDLAAYHANVEEKPELARDTLKRALDLTPSDADLHIEAAYYEALLGNRSGALGHLQQAESLSNFGSKTDTVRRLRRAIIEGSVNPALRKPPEDHYSERSLHPGNQSAEKQ